MLQITSHSTAMNRRYTPLSQHTLFIDPITFGVPVLCFGANVHSLYNVHNTQKLACEWPMGRKPTLMWLMMTNCSAIADTHAPHEYQKTYIVTSPSYPHWPNQTCIMFSTSTGKQKKKQKNRTNNDIVCGRIFPLVKRPSR